MVKLCPIRCVLTRHHEASNALSMADKTSLLYDDILTCPTTLSSLSQAPAPKLKCHNLEHKPKHVPPSPPSLIKPTLSPAPSKALCRASSQDIFTTHPPHFPATPPGETVCEEGKNAGQNFLAPSCAYCLLLSAQLPAYGWLINANIDVFFHYSNIP